MAPDCLQIKVNRQAKVESQLIALRNDCGFLRQRLHWFVNLGNIINEGHRQPSVLLGLPRHMIEQV